METNSNTKNIHFPEAEKLLESSRKELLENAKRDAKYFGLKNRPALTEPSCVQYIAPIKSQCEKIRADVLAIIQPDRYITAIQNLDANTKAKTSELTADIERLEHENDVDMRELEGKTPPEKRRPNYLGNALTIAINLVDIIFNSMIFEWLGHSLLYSIIFGIGVAGSLYIFSYGIQKFIRAAAAGGIKYYLAAFGLFALACTVFWEFSVSRSVVLSDSNASFSPVFFFSLNILFFTASILTPTFFFPPTKDVDADKELAARFAIVEKRKQEIKDLKQQLELLNKTTDEEKAKHMAILSYTAHTMNRITSLYHEAVTVFKGQNLLCRQDRSIPVSFSEAIPDLSGIQFNLPPSLNLPQS